MFIPLWLVKIFAWIMVSALGSAALLLAFGFAAVMCEALWKKIKLILICLGMFAAFRNYLHTILRAADGGMEWVGTFLDTQELDGDDLRTHNPPIYFKVRPHPEAWRWWMRAFGIKKPTAP